MINKFLYLISLFCLFLSCDRQLGYEESSDMIISLSLEGENISQRNQQSLQDLNSLRFIIVDGSNTVIRNDYLAQNQIATDIVINNLPSGVFNLYTIANEGEHGFYLDSNFKTGAQFNKDLLEQYTLTDLNQENILTSEIKNFLVEDRISRLNIVLTRSIIRFQVKVLNLSSSDIFIKNIGFGEVIPDKTHLFGNNPMNLPVNVQFRAYSQLINRSVTPSNSVIDAPIVMIFDSFETKVPEQNFSISVKCGQQILKPKQLSFPDIYIHEGNVELRRNTLVDVLITFNSFSDVIVDYSVVPWVEKNITIPDFN